jgi:hypothetical protein
MTDMLLEGRRTEHIATWILQNGTAGYYICNLGKKTWYQGCTSVFWIVVRRGIDNSSVCRVMTEGCLHERLRYKVCRPVVCLKD